MNIPFLQMTALKLSLQRKKRAAAAALLVIHILQFVNCLIPFVLNLVLNLNDNNLLYKDMIMIVNLNLTEALSRLNLAGDSKIQAEKNPSFFPQIDLIKCIRNSKE